MPEEEQQAVPTGEYINETQSRRQDARLTQWQLSAEDLIDRLEHYLKGEVPEWNRKEERWSWVRKGKRLMNDKGVKMVMSVVYPHVEKNTILSTIDPDEIAMVMRTLHKHLTMHLGSKVEEYKIDKHDLTLIVDIITNTIWFAVKRAEGGAEKKFLSASEKRVERTVEKEGGRRKSIIPFVGD